MKTTLPIILAMLCITGCKDDKQPFYRKIDSKTYILYKPVDTLYNTPLALITTCRDTITRFENFVTLVKKATGNKTEYYLLDTWDKVETDSTVILYGTIFKAPIDFKSNKGLWIYTKFYTEKTREEQVIESYEEGASFSVDSMPPNAESVSLPVTEGIYIYSHQLLIRISKEQSDEKFFAYHKNGFYFIPNTGALFKRYYIKDMK